MDKKAFIAGYMAAIEDSKTAEIGCPSWAHWDEWYPAQGSTTRLICFYRDIHGDFPSKDCEGDIRLIDGKWKASILSNNGWDVTPVGDFDDMESAMRACDGFVCSSGTYESDELYGLLR